MASLLVPLISRREAIASTDSPSSTGICRLFPQKPKSSTRRINGSGEVIEGEQEKLEVEEKI